MGARRFFVDGVHAVGDVVALASGDARKATLVLRLRAGDGIEICDSSGRTFAARLRVDAARAFAELVEEAASAPVESLEIVLAQALPKGQKMDYVVEKATELGVARILPAITERSLADAPQAKLERWQRIARTAAQQSGRAGVPVVEAPVSWRELFEREWRAAEGAAALVPWELAEPAALRDALPRLLEGVRRVLIAIGPEGGLSHDEAAFARERGASLVSLGRRILRTETAALVVCSVIRYATGEL